MTYLKQRDYVFLMLSSISLPRPKDRKLLIVEVRERGQEAVLVQSQRIENSQLRLGMSSAIAFPDSHKYADITSWNFEVVFIPHHSVNQKVRFNSTIASSASGIRPKLNQLSNYLNSWGSSRFHFSINTTTTTITINPTLSLLSLSIHTSFYRGFMYHLQLITAINLQSPLPWLTDLPTRILKSDLD